MIDVAARIRVIEQLMASAKPNDLTYAALECRLTFEALCYERLSIAHDYLAQDEIRKWQPKYVVNKLIQDVDPFANRTFTLSVSREPIEDDGDPITKDDFEGYDYVPVGTQIGLDPVKIGKLWNASSSFLHVTLPKKKGDEVLIYKDTETLKRKISEFVEELRSLGRGTLISSGFGQEVSFECNCGFLNKRRSVYLEE